MGPVRTGLLVAIALATCANPASSEDRGPAALRARGLYLTYSLDYDAARAAYEQAIAADPGDPSSYRQLAAVNWLDILFRSGAVLVDDYLGEVKRDVDRAAPPPDLDAQFRATIAKSLAIAEQRLRDRPRDADAHYQIGAALGYVASYTATVEGRVLGGFRAARRAYDENEHALDLDPGHKDAAFVVGLYRYGVSTLPLPFRLFAHLAGFGGGRSRGLRMVEEAAAASPDARTQARFVLIVMYSREERFDDALRVIEELQREYPSNRLLWLEAANTALRGRRPLEARRYVETGLSMLSHDPRPRAYGEMARWHLCHGTALAALDDVDGARRQLTAALASDAPAWVRDRARQEMRTHVRP